MMKKIMAMALAVILSAGTAFALPRFGIKAGMNINKLHFNNLKENFQPDNGCGFTAGLMTEFTFPIVGLGFDASLMYARMSSDVDITAADGVETDVMTSGAKNFFEIPVNVKYKLGIVPNVKPYIFTGPSFAFKLGGKDDVFKTKTFQCAWNIGLGVELFNHVQVGASYGFGMNNVADKLLDAEFTDNIKVKNNYWTITAAYIF